MNFDVFCAAVRAEFPGAHFLLFEDELYRAVVGRTCIGRRPAIAEPNAGAWWLDFNDGETVPFSRLPDLVSVLRGHALDTLNDARHLGVLPAPYAFALDAMDAVVNEDVAAMTPAQRAAAMDKLKAEIRRRLDERRKVN